MGMPVLTAMTMRAMRRRESTPVERRKESWLSK
jgi:hypothetical protein